MSRLDADQIQERNRLDALVKRKRLYCEKHQRLITLPLFWNRKCYTSRTGDACPYMVLSRAPGGGDSSNDESSPLPGRDVRREYGK